MREQLPYLTKGLDYYKATMSQLEHETLRDDEVTFALKNRSDKKLTEFCKPDELSARLAGTRHGWQPDEVAYLAGITAQDGQALFNESFLDYITDSPLPELTIGYSDDGDLSVETTGPAPLVTFWETVVMSEINELYFERMLQESGANLTDLYDEGDRRLSEKIAKLQKRPDIKISDFGTRRRFSYTWHEHVIDRLVNELPDNFVGTSNVYMAWKHNLTPIGTYAHELPMVYAAKSEQSTGNPLDGHNVMLQDWQQMYGEGLSTALTDTFGSEYFFTDISPEQAASFKALRHDSGDPFEFGERVIAYYESVGIDPATKTIVFSDGLDVDSIIALADRFGDRIDLMFGWGTTLTNDLGIKANNFVMKAVAVNGEPTVKLSDVAGKHTGPVEKVIQYEQEARIAIEMGASAYQFARDERLNNILVRC